MLKFLSIAAITIAAGTLGVAVSNAATILKPKGVVEVFTSQGCHSCPPADRMVGKLSKTNEILAISTHVDYWDYLGWKDIFATKANTQRQYSYARALRETQVYTPQAVINGRTHAVGSRENQVIGTVNTLADSNQGMVVPINVTVDANSLSINIDEHSVAKDATVYILSLKSVEKVDIERGENSGKTISYHNILKDRQPIGMVKAGGLQMQYPIAELKRMGGDCYAILLQNTDAQGNPSSIVGAVYIEDL